MRQGVSERKRRRPTQTQPRSVPNRRAQAVEKQSKVAMKTCRATSQIGHGLDRTSRRIERGVSRLPVDADDAHRSSDAFQRDGAFIRYGVSDGLRFDRLTRHDDLAGLREGADPCRLMHAIPA